MLLLSDFPVPTTSFFLLPLGFEETLVAVPWLPLGRLRLPQHPPFPFPLFFSPLLAHPEVRLDQVADVVGRTSRHFRFLTFFVRGNSFLGFFLKLHVFRPLFLVSFFPSIRSF